MPAVRSSRCPTTSRGDRLGHDQRVLAAERDRRSRLGRRGDHRGRCVDRSSPFDRDHWRRSDRRSSAHNLAKRRATSRSTFSTARTSRCPATTRRTRRRLARELAEVGVHLHPGHRASVPTGSPTDRLTTEPVEWSTGQDPFAADLVLWSIGDVQPNSDFLPETMLDEHGFVHVDEHLRVPGHRDVYAVGDVAASDPARSSARNCVPGRGAQHPRPRPRREDQARLVHGAEVPLGVDRRPPGRRDGHPSAERAGDPGAALGPANEC